MWYLGGFFARLLTCLVVSAAPQSEPTTVPADLKICARFASGGTSAVPWEATISADGECTLIYHEDGKEVRKRVILTKEQIAKLNKIVDDSRFFLKKNKYEGGVEDSWGFALTVLRGGRTHRVSVGGLENLRDDKDVQELVRLWRAIAVRVPSPNDGGELELIEDTWK